jgi:hypothetical protein
VCRPSYSVPFEITLQGVSLNVSVLPSGARSREPFDTQPVVHILDPDGRLVSSDSGMTVVTASLLSGIIDNPRNGTLLGHNKVTCCLGVCKFTDLSIDRAFSAYRISFDSPPFTTATSCESLPLHPIRCPSPSRARAIQLSHNFCLASSISSTSTSSLSASPLTLILTPEPISQLPFPSSALPASSSYCNQQAPSPTSPSSLSPASASSPIPACLYLRSLSPKASGILQSPRQYRRELAQTVRRWRARPLSRLLMAWPSSQICQSQALDRHFSSYSKVPTLMTHSLFRLTSTTPSGQTHVQMASAAQRDRVWATMQHTLTVAQKWFFLVVFYEL